ncbi:MAG: zinc-dependent metalloprotease [Burkholderiales bacterium]|nr:zinc-dependent metalloprotease [Burkholderiales bacterium]
MRSTSFLAALAAATVLAGCAGLPPAPADGTTATATPVVASAGNGVTARPPTPPPASGSLRPFADVARDARESPGLFHVWQRDDRVYLELAPDQFERAYFFSTHLDQGLGEHRFLAGLMASSQTRGFGGPRIVSFRRIGNSVQLIARNVRFTAQPGTPEALGVADAFSDSLLASAPIVSQPHPERKSVLVDANALFFTDLPGAAPRLELAYRQPYAFDARNSSFRAVTSETDFASFVVAAHYALARVALPQPGATPAAEPPSTLPDLRSLFLGFHYSLAKLPDTPMTPRVADPRIGYFTTDVFDFTTDDRRVPIVHYVNRWRLEKKDPTAALSEPKQPIVYWIDRNVPRQYRDAIRDGVLEWNKAFERIGFIDAIRVEIQPDDASFNTSDVRHASIRWIATARTSFAAIGPRVVDPRTGEILDADIAIDATAFRAQRAVVAETIPSPAPAGHAASGRDAACSYATEATADQAFALALLEARGALTLDGPQAEAFLRGHLKEVTMHEVGHTLGLTHNFRASTAYAADRLTDPEFTRQHGIAGSVMEYNAVNLALRGERQGEYHMSTLGPYDYWAIEYAYREIAPAAEATELARIARRSSEPELAFMVDDTLYVSGLDPQVNTFDLGADPLAYAARQLELGRELWQLSASRTLHPDESYAVLRRNFDRGLARVRWSAVTAGKYIGGLTLRSDHAGSGRIPLEPVPAAKQRAALDLLVTTIFAADGFTFPPAFLSRLALSDTDIDDAQALGRGTPTVDVAVDQKVLEVQRAVLGPLLGADVAQRLQNNALKVDVPAQALTAAELYANLHRAIFSEFRAGRDVPLLRRNLQREYVARVALVLVRPAPNMPADARALLRADAVALRAELAAAGKRRTLSVETRAHLAESVATLDEALRAPLLRQAL